MPVSSPSRSLARHFWLAGLTLLAGLFAFTPCASALDFASGADVSWLPQMEAAGVKYKDANGNVGDLLTIMHGMGFNAIRLRTWVNPSNDACNGHCSQSETIAMAVRVQNAGMRVMIDFHYGDTWNSEGTQNPPAAWANMTYAQMQVALYNYTFGFCTALQAAGVTPEWISTGNEENSGICHPIGSISNPAQMTGLIMQGYNAVKAVFPNCNVVIHVAGPQNASAQTMLDDYQANGGKWDITGFSSYASGSDVPGVQANAASWVARYGKPIMQVEVGGPVTDPSGTQSTIQACINALKASGTNGRGIFFWEPEATTCGYTLNAWNGTTEQATVALTPFQTANTTLTPITPLGLTAASGNPQVSLSWGTSASATSYNIKRSTTTGGPYTTVATVSSTSYVNTAVTNGVTYFYVVSGFNSLGESGNSAETQATPLAQPTFVTWQGDGVSNTWTAGNNTNWSNGTAAVSYVTGYNVAFDDTGSASPTINISGTLLPGSVSVNATKNYTFGGTGSLTGTMPLDKEGSGTLTLSNANTFTGMTTLTAGTLQLANALALQNSILNSNGGTLAYSGITSATLAGLTGTQNQNLANTASAAVALTVGGGNVNTTYSGALTGSGSLIKNGNATLTLTGHNTYTGSTTVNLGILELPAGGSLTSGVLNGAGYLVDGGTLTASGTTTFSDLNNAFLETSGTATFGTVTESNGDGLLIKITGGTFTASSLTLQRTASFTTPPTPTAPIAAGTTSGFYVDGASANVTLGTATIGNNNSSASARVDAGNVTFTGKFLVGHTTNTRWSILQISGGTITSTDTVNGIVITQNNGTSINNAEFYCSGGVTTAEKIAFGVSTDTVGGSGFLIIGGGALYLGGGGLIQPNTTGLTSNISLLSGLLGAKADWSSTLPMQLSGTSFTIQAADISGLAHNITLTGALFGAGNLTKTGLGTLTLNATNNNTGNTTVTAGTLVISGTLPGKLVILQSGAALGGSGKISGNLTLPSGAGFLLNSSGNLAVAGNVTLSGNIAVTAAANLTVGNYTLLGYNGTLTGTPVFSYVPPAGASQAATFSTATAHVISVTVFGPPATPTGITATPGNGNVTLNWTASTGATSYTIQRSTTSGSGFSTLVSGVTSTTYLDLTAANGTQYYYIVTATNSAGSSPNSTQVNTTPLPPAPTTPTNFAATPGNGNVTLTWSPVSGATAYTLQRSTTSGTGYITVNSAISASPYLDLNLVNGTTYYYVLAASNLGGTSPNSVQVSALPAATLAQWTSAAFPGVTNANITGPSADPDGDGLSNLVEYLLGTNPTVPDSAGAAMSSAADGSGNLILTFRLSKNLTGVTYTVQSSTDLVNWSDTGVTPTIQSDQGAYYLMQAAVTLGSNAKLYLRLKATSP